MKKILFFCLFFAVVNIAYSQHEDLYRAVYNGDIKWINEYFININTPTDHFEFSNNDLRILRNTIYAMHGYIFKSRDLQEHFQKFSWYSGTKSNVDNELSKNELSKIRIIAATEAANPPALKNLAGRWQWPAPPGSNAETLGFKDMYLYENGTMSAELLWDIEGFWSLDGTTFRIRYFNNRSGKEVIKEKKNFRINFIEYNGELFQVADFPITWFNDDDVYGYSSYFGPNKRPPAKRWGYKEQK